MEKVLKLLENDARLTNAQLAVLLGISEEEAAQCAEKFNMSPDEFKAKPNSY